MSNSLEFCELGFRILGLLVSQLGPPRSRACARSWAGWVTWAGGILGSRYEGVWRLEQGRNEGCLNARGASMVPLQTPEKPGGLTSPPGRRRAGSIVHSPLVEGRPGISLPALCSCSCTGLSNPLGDRESPRPAPSRWVR